MWCLQLKFWAICIMGYDQVRAMVIINPGSQTWEKYYSSVTKRILSCLQTRYISRTYTRISVPSSVPGRYYISCCYYVISMILKGELDSWEIKPLAGPIMQEPNQQVNWFGIFFLSWSLLLRFIFWWVSTLLFIKPAEPWVDCSTGSLCLLLPKKGL